MLASNCQRIRVSDSIWISRGHGLLDAKARYRLLDIGSDSLGYQLALYLGDSEAVERLGRSVTSVYSQGEIHSGREIATSIEAVIPRQLITPAIHILMNEGVIVVQKSNYSIEGYLFKLDRELLSVFLDAQTKACSVINEMERKGSARRQDIEFVATLPPTLLVNREIDIGSIDSALRRMLVSASKRIAIANPFFDAFGMEAISQTLVARASAGVDVNLLTRGVLEKEEGAIVRPLIAELVDRFQEGKIQHKLSLRDFYKRDADTGRIVYALHSKIVIIDEKECYLGSANVTQHGLKHNFELGVVLRGNEIRPVLDLFEYVWNESNEVLPEHLR